MKRDVLDLALLVFLLTGLGAVVVVLDATITKDAPWLNGDRRQPTTGSTDTASSDEGSRKSASRNKCLD
jgi:hypothetical protein